MVKRSVIKCNFCNEKIILRFQIGYFDIPFDFYCPNCGVSINGTQYIEKNEFEVNNATEVEENVDSVMYYGNFSTEFLNKKICKFSSLEDILSDGFGPFVSTSMLFDNYEQYKKIIDNISCFLKFKKSTWNTLYSLYELFFNYKLNLIKKPLLEYSDNYVIKNELDAVISLHQLTTIGMNFVMPDDTLSQYTQLSKELMSEKNIKEINKFIDFLKYRNNFNDLSQKIVNIYNKWNKDFEKYMAVVMLSIGNKTEVIDKEIYGITTINFEDMKNFFEDSYELILEMFTIPVGLNNIFERGNYNNFSFQSKIKDFDNFFSQTKYARTEALIDGERFSKPLNLNNRVRNSIAHYDYKFNKGNQIITFFDKYKNNTNTIEMYFFEFAICCYENIKNIMYLNELFYTLRKIDYLRKGIKPNIDPNFKQINLFVE